MNRLIRIGDTLVNLEHATTIDLQRCVTQAGKPDRPHAVAITFTNGQQRHFHGDDAEALRWYYSDYISLARPIETPEPQLTEAS